MCSSVDIYFLTHLNKYFMCSLFNNTLIIQIDLVVLLITEQRNKIEAGC